MIKTKYIGLLALMWANVAAALPTDPSVVNGQVQVNTNAAVMQILQSSPQAIINWGAFNIRPDEIVRFLQPNQMSLILNRVTGMDPSVLEGLLQANGRVFLINPNGILIQSGARIDVGSFMASTLNMSDQDFLAGNYRLQQQSDKPLAALVNNGSIQVSEGGFVVLTSPLLHNAGFILAQSGEVRLGATSQATFSVDGKGMLQFSVPDGFTHDFRNTSPGGTVLVSPSQMSQMLAQAITSPSIQEAPELPPEGLLVHSGSIEVGSGSIRLDSSRATVATGGSSLSGGDVRLLSAGLGLSDGRISAPGGFVEVSGREIGLHGPVDVRGGQLLLDPENLNLVDGPGTRTPPIIASSDPGTTQTVDTGVISASMGTVTLQATNNVTYLDTFAGFQAPDADLVISAGNNVEFSAHVGPGFFDPSRDLNIHANSINISAPNVTFASQGTGGVNMTTTGDFRVNSGNDITVSNGQNLVAGGNLSLLAGNNLSVTSVRDLTATNGNLTLQGQNTTISSTGDPSLQGANVTVRGSNNLNMDAFAGSLGIAINATAGNVDLEGGNITLTTRFDVPMRLSATDQILVNATNDLVFNASTFSSGLNTNSNLVLTANNSTLHADQDLFSNVTTINSTGPLRLDAGGDVWLRRTIAGTYLEVTAPSIDIRAGGVINVTDGASFALNATTGNLSLNSVGTQALVVTGNTGRLDAAGNIVVNGSFVQANVPSFSVNATGDVDLRNVFANGDVNITAGNNLLVRSLASPGNPNTDFDLRGGNITVSSFQNVTGIHNLTLTTPGALRDLVSTGNNSNLGITNLNITAGSIAGTGPFSGFAVPNVTLGQPRVTVTGGNVLVAPAPAAASLLQLQGSTIQLTTLPNQTGDVYIDGSLVGGGPPPNPPPPGPPPPPPPVPNGAPTPPVVTAPLAARAAVDSGLTDAQRAELLNQVAQSNPYLGNRTGLSEVLTQVQRDRITQVAQTTDVLSPTLSVVLSRNLDPMTPSDRKFFDGLSVIVSDETREKKNVAYATMVDQEVREIWEVHYWRRLIEGMVLWEESQ